LKTCVSCKYFHFSGKCIANPPQAKVMVRDGSSFLDSVFPKVSSSSSCGIWDDGKEESEGALGTIFGCLILMALTAILVWFSTMWKYETLIENQAFKCSLGDYRGDL